MKNKKAYRLLVLKRGCNIKLQLIKRENEATHKSKPFSARAGALLFTVGIVQPKGCKLGENLIREMVDLPLVLNSNYLSETKF